MFLMAMSVVAHRAAAVPEEVSGKVTEVVDGDTVRVETPAGIKEFKLYGVDCPEKGQPQYDEACKFVSTLLVGKDVKCNVVEGGGAYVTLSDDTDVNTRIVAEGYAWWNKKEAAGDRGLRTANAEALKGKKGLWKDPAPLAPWDYRASNPADADKDDEQVCINAEKKNLVYHKETCALVKNGNMKLSRRMAKQFQYSPCRECLPEEQEDDKQSLAHKGEAKEGAPTKQLPPPPPLPVAAPVAQATPAPALQKPTKNYTLEEAMVEFQPEFVTGPDGNVLGLTAKNVSNIPYAPQLGFRDGDIVSQVNGSPLNSPTAAMEMYERFKDARSLDVVVIRGGQPVNINIPIPR
jgi:endonuclease YncB( thermonuclease family)